MLNKNKKGKGGGVFLVLVLILIIFIFIKTNGFSKFENLNSYKVVVNDNEKEVFCIQRELTTSEMMVSKGYSSFDSCVLDCIDYANKRGGSYSCSQG